MEDSGSRENIRGMLDLGRGLVRLRHARDGLFFAAEILMPREFTEKDVQGMDSMHLAAVGLLNGLAGRMEPARAPSCTGSCARAHIHQQ